MRKIVRIMTVALILCFLFVGSCWAEAFSPDRIKGKIEKLTVAALTYLPVEATTKPVIAIVDIQSDYADTIDAGFMEFIKNQLVEKIHASNRVTLVDRQNIQEVFKELLINSVDTLVDPETAKKFGKQIGADILAIPSITLVNSTVQLELRLTDVETGKIVAVASIQLMDRLSPQLKREDTVAVSSATSLDQTATIIASGMRQTDIFIYPPSVGNSSEVTQFAEVLKGKLAEKLQTVAQEDKARYFLNGSYQIAASGIELTYNLLDSKYKTVATKVIRVSPTAYQNLQIQPQNESFSNLLRQEDSVSSDLRVEVKSNKGSRQLLFKQGEEVELFVRLNKAGYFYAVGHTKKPGEDYSYLMPTGSGEGPRKFIYAVNDATAGKWISLGKFEVSPPFGLESLQIIASAKEPAQIPAYNLDKTTELFLIARNAEEGIVRTRALKPKPATDNSSAEAVLVFNTSP